MKKLKKIIGIVTVLIFIMAGYGWYLFNKQPADVRKQAPQVELKTEKLVSDFKENETSANQKYVGKILIISGKVINTQIDSAGHATVFLNGGDPLSSVVCSFYNDEVTSVKKIAPGTEVRIKGECTGMLMDVILNKCSMIE